MIVKDLRILYLQKFNKKFAKIDCKAKHKTNKIIKEIAFNAQARQLIELKKFIEVQSTTLFANTKTIYLR
jgi:hypothetical protein